VTTDHEPLVSAVIIFKDEERFLNEAVASVVAQSYRSWELVLVDDGSTDASTEVARQWAASHRPQIRYVEHPGHANRGMSAARNLGLRSTSGELVAFLDADDVWLPGKLERQVADLLHHPTAAFTYGPLLRWWRWNGVPSDAGNEDLMGVGRRRRGPHPLAGTVARPPTLARLMLRDDYFIPGGALFRREAIQAVGGYDDEFPGLYEDAVVLMKLCLRFPVHISSYVSYLYRMHDQSCTHRNRSETMVDTARRAYLERIDQYLVNEGLWTPELGRAVARAARTSVGRRRRRQRLAGIGRRTARSVVPRPIRSLLRRLRPVDRHLIAVVDTGS